jgi:hypothetical protein
MHERGSQVADSVVVERIEVGRRVEGSTDSSDCSGISAAEGSTFTMGFQSAEKGVERNGRKLPRGSVQAPRVVESFDEIDDRIAIVARTIRRR